MTLEELFNFGTSEAGVPPLGEVAMAMGISLVLNLVIAVIVNAMHREYDEHADAERDDILAEIKALRAEVQALSERR